MGAVGLEESAASCAAQRRERARGEGKRAVSGRYSIQGRPWTQRQRRWLACEED